MVIFNSYVSLPESNLWWVAQFFQTSPRFPGPLLKKRHDGRGYPPEINHGHGGFFLRTSPPPSMQPRPMVFGPVLWDKSPTKLFSSKKMGIEQGNVYEIANNFIDHCVWKWPQNLLSPQKNPRISGSRENRPIWAGTPAGRHVFAGGFGPQRPRSTPPRCGKQCDM